MIVDSAVYAGGCRLTPSGSLGETYRSCQAPDRFAWVTLYEPTEKEFVSVAEEFQLHELAADDAIQDTRGLSSNATKTGSSPCLSRHVT